MAFYSLVPTFVDLTKITYSLLSKFVVKVFSFIIYAENFYFIVFGIRGSDPPRKPRKFVPYENKAINTISIKFDFHILYTLQYLHY